MPKSRSQDTGFSNLYGQLLEEFSRQVGEPRSAYGDANRNVREEIVRCLWFGSHFAPEKLMTDDGRHIEAVSPGWWNVEKGPDFIRAELLIEGTGRIVGDVEVHVFASDWYNHGHDKQPEYDGVVLHVTMWNDAEGKEIRTSAGAAIPQITLSRAVEDEMEELVEVVDMESAPAAKPGDDEGGQHPVPGRYCGDAFARGDLKPEWLAKLLDCAGDYRLTAKSDAMRRLLEKQPTEQVLYECVAEALGYKNNRLPFRQLTKLLTVQSLRDLTAGNSMEERYATIEAAMLGVAGFLDKTDGADEETRLYLERLRTSWEQLPSALRDTKMSEGHWTLAGTRPVNYPTRRIAALACLYAQHLGGGLFGHLVSVVSATGPEKRRSFSASLRKALSRVFTDVQHPYWSWRYTFSGKRLASACALVGAERAVSITVDVAIPLLLAHARTEGDTELTRRLYVLWTGIPRREPNAVVRRMSQVLFHNTTGMPDLVNSARRQQGLHQIYNDFCRTDGGCERCVVYLAHRAGKRLAEVV